MAPHVLSFYIFYVKDRKNLYCLNSEQKPFIYANFAMNLSGVCMIAFHMCWSVLDACTTFPQVSGRLGAIREAKQLSLCFYL